MEIVSMECCGVRELNGISETTAKEAVKDLCEGDNYDRYQEPNFAFAIFTDIRRMARGNALAKYIVENKLGTITVSEKKVNPNSRNSLRVWTWAINHDNLKRWYNKHYPRQEDDDYDN